MFTIACQPSDNHPGKLHLTSNGSKTLCGRYVLGESWGNRSPIVTLKGYQCLDDEDCQKCLNIASNRGI